MEKESYLLNKGVDVYRLALDIIKEFTIKTMRDNERILYYKEGRYITTDAESLIKEKIQAILKENTKKFTVSEVIGHIQRLSYLARSEFNRNKHLVNLKNGVLNLNTFQLIEHSPNLHFTFQIPAKYNPSAKCDNFIRFSNQVLEPKDILFMQEFLGHLLLRDYRFKAILFMIGGGDNGKTTYLKVIETLLGLENISHISMDNILEDKFSIAELYGKHANITAESPRGKISNSDILKKLSGNDVVSVREIYGKPFEMVNFAKLIFAGNELPQSEDVSDAYINRVKLIKFLNQFTGKNADKEILDRLTNEEELSGILNYALEGLKRLLNQNEFSYVGNTDEFRSQYLLYSSSIEEFADVHLIVDREGWTSTGNLYKEYCNYCKKKCYPSASNNVFGKDIKQIILRINPNAIDKRHNNSPGWAGISLKTMLTW